MNITWFGCASLLIENGTDRVLIDPFLALPGAAHHPSLQTYQKEETILVTHGHIDHLSSIPLILRGSDATVYCSRTPAATLEKKRTDCDRIVVIRPEDELLFGSMKVTALSGRHIQFDRRLIRHTFFNSRILQYFPNFLRLSAHNFLYKENGETLAFQIDGGDKRLLVLGSLNIREDVEYPKHADMLVLPYQGASDLVSPALSIIERLQPKTVFLDHFDDAFPPISSQIDTKPLKKAIAERYPDLPVVKPAAGKPITLP